VPNQQGVYPAPNDFPHTINELLVAGNESLPNGNVNWWNKKKSSSLLLFYGEAGTESENDDEHSSRSRARRLRLAKKIGITRTQLNFAQLVL